MPPTPPQTAPAIASGRARCPICGQDAAAYCRTPPAQYFRCPACATIFQHPLPSIEEMAAFAEREYTGGLYGEYVAARPLKEATFRLRMPAITRRANGRRLLDVGCSCGYLIDVALDAGFDATGVEFSAAAIAAASERARPRIARGDVNRLPEFVRGAFDVVTAFDLVEHTLDPVRFLGDLRGLLAPGGLLALTTPDAGHVLRPLMGRYWPMLQPYQHPCLFSKRSLTLALERAGYVGIGIEPARKTLTPEYLLGQIRGYVPGVARLYGAIAPVIPGRLRHMLMSVNIGEITAFARRGDAA